MKCTVYLGTQLILSILIICKYHLQKWRSICATLKCHTQVALLKSTYRQDCHEIYESPSYFQISNINWVFKVTKQIFSYNVPYKLYSCKHLVLYSLYKLFLFFYFFFFSLHLNFIFRQFKTAEDVPAPYKSDTRVLVGIVTIMYLFL